ncbi:uncharacterized protein MONBRDRAFT_34414 [Monosiga brevicollis MX1]|uniref:Uncharacterized protein n=1 Tax=Monosiga brevicollis TaxID=81824 RepID=A9VBK5_MONBE|nr:uncharacterized protein MONBRDRAFT_34414 [Monosiga brevicollis MX1]EDQ85079.1 predicted protein [Monosiga brevicollis MX1]|eukprot:XP_001750083.1 hypothetical protein [Monosiga brevicollis MX1]
MTTFDTVPSPPSTLRPTRASRPTTPDRGMLITPSPKRHMHPKQHPEEMTSKLSPSNVSSHFRGVLQESGLINREINFAPARSLASPPPPPNMSAGEALVNQLLRQQQRQRNRGTYDQLRARAAQHRDRGQHLQQRVRSVQRNQQEQDRAVQREVHREAWRMGHRNLRAAAQQLEAELQPIALALLGPDTHYRQAINEQADQLFHALQTAYRDLRAAWLRQQQQAESLQQDQTAPDTRLHRLQAMVDDQFLALRPQAEALQAELALLDQVVSTHAQHASRADALQQTCRSLLEHCPDSDLSQALTTELDDLLREAQQRQADLDQAYRVILETPHGDLAPDHYATLEWLLELYRSLTLPPALKSKGVTRRLLAVERAAQVLGIDRNTISNHENHILGRTFYRRKQKFVNMRGFSYVLIAMFAEDREHTLTTLRELQEYHTYLQQAVTDAIAAAFADEQATSERERQQQRQLRLYTTLQQLRAQRQAALQARLREAEETEQRQRRATAAEAERERAERQRIKDLIRQRQEQQRQAEEAFQRQRAAAAEEARAERQRQQRHNQRRTSYRRRELEDREAERQRQAEAELRLVEERERRLEALRAQVRPEVEDDPTRVWQPTKAQLRAAEDAREQRRLREALPRLGVEGYSDTTVTSDRRWRLFQALRHAGLDGTAYGQAAMAQATATVPQRRDMNATLFQPSGALL